MSRGGRRTAGSARVLAGWTLAVAAAVAPPVAAGETTLPADDPRVTRWEKDVAAFERADAAAADPAGAVLFVGSSSIRLWETIAADMAPYPAVRRGYGGARYRDLAHFAGRLVARHDPRAIVVFSANDMSDEDGPPPEVERVMVDVRATHALIRDRHPEVPILLVAVTPTEKRWRLWPRIQRLNLAIERLCADEPHTAFVATAERFLDPDTGRPDPALFKSDRLHLSAAGYAEWAAAISTALDEVLAASPAGGR